MIKKWKIWGFYNKDLEYHSISEIILVILKKDLNYIRFALNDWPKNAMILNDLHDLKINKIKQ